METLKMENVSLVSNGLRICRARSETYDLVALWKL